MHKWVPFSRQLKGQNINNVPVYVWVCCRWKLVYKNLYGLVCIWWSFMCACPQSLARIFSKEIKETLLFWNKSYAQAWLCGSPNTCTGDTLPMSPPHQTTPTIHPTFPPGPSSGLRSNLLPFSWSFVATLQLLPFQFEPIPSFPSKQEIALSKKRNSWKESKRKVGGFDEHLLGERPLIPLSIPIFLLFFPQVYHTSPLLVSTNRPHSPAAAADSAKVEHFYGRTFVRLQTIFRFSPNSEVMGGLFCQMADISRTLLVCGRWPELLPAGGRRERGKISERERREMIDMVPQGEEEAQF